MKTTITRKRYDPDTINGERFQIIYTYTSFNKIEMDEFENKINEQMHGSCALVIDDEDDLK